MPGKGGAQFIALQFLGWSCFTLCESIGLMSVYFQCQEVILGYSNAIEEFPQLLTFLTAFPKPDSAGKLTTVSSFFGFFGQLIIATSLFFYQAQIADLRVPIVSQGPSTILRFLRSTRYLGLNVFFSGGTSYKQSRWPKISKPDDWMEGERRWKSVAEKAGALKKTGDQVTCFINCL